MWTRVGLTGALAYALMTVVLPGAEAAPITASATAIYTQGPGNDSSPPAFTIIHSSDAGVTLTGITIVLKSGLQFDVAAGAPGGDPAHAFAVTSNPGGVGVTPSSVSDGATSLSVSFTGFSAPGTLEFTIDVDRAGSGNAVRSVSAEQFEDSTITFTFAGPFIGSPLTTAPLSFQHPFQSQGSDAGVTFSGQANPVTPPALVPEPGSMVLWALAAFVSAGGCLRRRKAG
jgi:hypothetical protein